MNNKLKRELRVTADGSHTLYTPSLDEHYHSTNGAIQESNHIFIEAGLNKTLKEHIRILEIGFGTGLNAFLTLLEVEKQKKQSVQYYSVELYPLEMGIIETLNYAQQICPEQEEIFKSLHTASWNEDIQITESFNLHKIEGDCNQIALPSEIDLIYFDAFAPEKQADMWNYTLFKKLYDHAATGAIIVTYCAKGEVRRMMQSAGFSMQRLPGPPGKRHILFGSKE